MVRWHLLVLTMQEERGRRTMTIVSWWHGLSVCVSEPGVGLWRAPLFLPDCLTLLTTHRAQAQQPHQAHAYYTSEPTVSSKNHNSAPAALPGTPPRCPHST